MEDFIDPFLEPSSWADMSSSLKSYRGDDKSPPICMISSNMEDVDLYGHDDGNSPFFIDANLKYGISKDLFSGESLLHHDNSTHDDSFSLECMIKNNSTGGSFGSELNTTCSVTLPHNSLSVTSSIESNGSEPSGFPPSLGDAHSISSAMWPSSYSDVSFMGQGKLHGFGFEDLGNDAEILKKTPVVRGTYSALDSLPGASLQDQNELRNSQISYFGSSFQPHQQEQNGTSNIQLPFLSAGSQILLSKVAGMQTRQQPTQVNTTKHQTNNSSGNQSHLPPSNTTASNGDAKPRVRARRGQATDPHSIAERLRREKIAERMKNLQELVPNSNKTDKASMLDEIIDYVRFLQLQVKVLSMSRLGAAGAVVPLITDSQSELSSNPFQSPSGGKRVSDLSELEDNLAFEEEVVKLMESNVTTAMQFLQNKGLCLMPIALASAISTQKGTSAAMDRRSLCVVERNGMEDNGAIKNEEALNSLGN